MTRLKALFPHISSQMDLIGLLIMLVFVTMVRPVNAIMDMESHGGLLFLALDRQGVRVLDVAADPAQPLEVGMYNTSGSARALSLRAEGDEKKLFVADGRGGVRVFDVSPQGSLAYSWGVPNLTPAEDIAIRGKYAFLARGKNGLTILKVDQGEPKEGQIWPLEESPNVVRVVVGENKIYLVDNQWQVYRLDFNPDQPDKATVSQPYPVGVPVNDLFISNGVLYLATQGSGLLLLDTDRSPEEAIISQYTGFENVRSVEVYGAFAYLSAGPRGVQVVEISQPQDIVRVGEIRQVGIGEVASIHPPRDGEPAPKATPILRDLDAQKLTWAGSTLYVSDGLSGLRAVKPRQVFDIRVADILGGINNEESWAEAVVTGRTRGDRTYAFMAGGDRGLWVLDVTRKERLEDVPYKVSPAREDIKPLSGYANAVAVHEEMVYLSYRDKGIQLLDVSDPQNLVAYPPVKYNGETYDIAIHEGAYLLVAAGSNGLRVLDVQARDSARQISSEDTPGQALGVTVQGQYAFLAAGEAGGLQILDVEDITKPTLVASLDTPGGARAVAVYIYREKEDSQPERFAYLADGDQGLLVANVSNPRDPVLIRSIPLGGQVRDVVVAGDKLYVTEGNEGLYIFNLADPRNPAQTSRIDTPGRAAGVYVEGDFAYVADHNRGLRVINIANPSDPRENGKFDLPTRVKDLVISADRQYAYLVGDAAGMWSVHLGDPKNPIPVNLLEIPGEATRIDMGSGDRAYLADGSRGFHVVDLSRESGKPVQPALLTTYAELKDVRRVKEVEGIAYVANGEAGLSTLDMGNLGKIQPKGKYGTSGYALNVDVSGSYVYGVSTVGKIDIWLIQSPGDLEPKVPDPAMDTLLVEPFNMDIIPQWEYAYVSDGVNGLVVLDVSQPLSPEKVFHLDTPGTLKDVALLDYYAFLADGDRGVDLLYGPQKAVFNPDPAAYFTFDPTSADGPQNCVPNAMNIAALPHIIAKEEVEGVRQDVLHHYAYVASDQCGLVTLEYRIAVVFEQLGLYPTPGGASLRVVASSYGGVIVEMIKGTMKGGLELLDAPAIARVHLVGHARALDQRIKDTAREYIFGLELLTIGMLLWLALSAYFVLPIRQLRAGLKSYLWLLLYFRWFHGPVVLAREGQAETRALKPHWPGVALVDLNSAVVIEEYPAQGLLLNLLTRRKQKKRRQAGLPEFQARVEGPGLVFLGPRERVQSVADLRRQIRLRLQVHAHTRDAIELETHVFVGFTLGEPPEVLMVTYDGPPVEGNLRVVSLRDDWLPIPGTQGKERQVKRVSDMEDDLDPADKNEIHRYLRDLGLGEGLGSPPQDEPRPSPFQFDEKRVYKALVSRPYDIDEQEIQDWAELPADVAAGLFRNLINLQKYNDLFQPEEPES